MKKKYVSSVVKVTEVDMSECILQGSTNLSAKNDIFADESDALVNCLDDAFADIWDDAWK